MWDYEGKVQEDVRSLVYLGTVGVDFLAIDEALQANVDARRLKLIIPST